MVVEIQEKVTIVLPKNLKNDVEALKKRLNISMNSIYQTAIAEYMDKKRREQLQAEAAQMIEEYTTNAELVELSSFQEDVHDY